MVTPRLLARISRQGVAAAAAAARRCPEATLGCAAPWAVAAEPCAASCSSIKVPFMLNQPLRYSTTIFQRFGFSSSAPQQNDKEASQPTYQDNTKAGSNTEASNATDNSSRTESDEVPKEGSEKSKSRSNKRKRGTKRTAFSDSDTEELDLSKEELVKLVVEKEELLKSKEEEIEAMKDKVLRSYAEMENVISRTKRESENNKKYGIQSFAKSLIDVADNLARASSVVKESFSKIDTSKDSTGAVPLLKTLLEGVEMTEKQLSEALKKFGVEKFDPLNERFDPNRHYALFQIADPSKTSGTVASVLKVGYMLHDRVLRPAEVGVTEGGPTEDQEQNSNGRD